MGNNYLFGVPSKEDFARNLNRINAEFCRINKHPYDLLMKSRYRYEISCTPFRVYVEDYIPFVAKQMELEVLSNECINNLLSANRAAQKQSLKLAVWFHGFTPLVMVDAYLSHYATLYAKRIKQGVKDEIYTVVEEFSIAARSMKEHKLLEECKYCVKDYLMLKITELNILREKMRFQSEEEENRRKLREEQKVLKELKKEKEQAEKDAEKARLAIEKNEEAIAKAKNEKQIIKLKAQIEDLKLALQKAEERRERAISMAQQTRCGYVYVISNIGSFGEGVYKIGMTRRIDPMQRVRELGDASVPFPFDVHAMIYTEDAPSLEAKLHQAFELQKVNAVNWRKEYFRVSLEDIRKEVEKCGIQCEWVERTKATQYRDSERMRHIGNLDASEIQRYMKEHPEEFEGIIHAFDEDPFEDLE